MVWVFFCIFFCAPSIRKLLKSLAILRTQTNTPAIYTGSEKPFHWSGSPVIPRVGGQFLCWYVRLPLPSCCFFFFLFPGQVMDPCNRIGGYQLPPQKTDIFGPPQKNDVFWCVLLKNRILLSNLGVHPLVLGIKNGYVTYVFFSNLNLSFFC